MGHPSDYFSLTGESHTSVIETKEKSRLNPKNQPSDQTLRTNSKSRSNTIPAQPELCQCQASILIQLTTKKFNVILLSRLTRCQCCKHLIKPRFVLTVDK
jgi:hypothetical protein